MDHLSRDQLNIRGADLDKVPRKSSGDYKHARDGRTGSVDAKVLYHGPPLCETDSFWWKDLEDLLAVGDIKLESRAGDTAVSRAVSRSASVRRRETMPPEQLNTIKLPIVSSSESEALREKMVQKAPTGLHQMALRNLRCVYQ